MRHQRRLRKRKFSQALTAAALVIGLAMTLYFFYPVFASPPSSPYTPGETLNPSCSPGDTNCTVSAPMVTTFSGTTTVTMGSFPLNFDTGTLYIEPQNNRVGFGTTTPATRVHIVGTTEQLRLAYDAANYAALTVDSDGSLTLAPTNSATTTVSGKFSVVGNSFFAAIASGTWNGTAVGAQYGGTGQNSSAWTGVVVVNNGTWSQSSTLGISAGGTGSSTIGSAGSVPYSNGSAYLFTSAGSLGQLLQSNGSGAPTWVNTTSLAYLFLQGVTSGTQQTGHFNISGTGLVGILGVNTTSPVARLAVQGAANSAPIFDVASSTGSSLLRITASGRVGVGTTTPAAHLELLAATEQLRLSYDGSNSASFTVSSDGSLTLAPTNNATTTVSGKLSVLGNASFATIASGTWNGSAVGAQYGGTGQNSSAWTGVAVINSGTWSQSSTLGILVGGTGSSTVGNAGSVAYSNGSAYAFTAAGSSGQLLQSNGSGAPAWVSTTSLGYLFLQGATAGTQQTGHFNISGTGLVGRFGVNTTSPIAQLAVQGNNGINLFEIASSTGSSLLRVLTNGNVGINSSTPQAQLTVRGAAGSADVLDIASSTSASLFKVTAGGFVGINTTTPVAQLAIQMNDSQIPFEIASSTDSSLMRVLPNGRIGILTADPTNALTFASTATSGIAIYNTADQTTNYERGILSWISNVFTLRAQTGGSGTNRSVQVLAGDGSGLSIGNFGTTSLIGTSGGLSYIAVLGDAAGISLLGRITSQSTPVIQLTNSPFGTAFSASSGAQQLIAISSAVNQSGSAKYDALKVEVTENSIGTGTSTLLRLSVVSSTIGGERFAVTRAGYVLANTTTPVATLNLQGRPSADPVFNAASSTGSSLMRILANGNVLIGTTTNATGYRLFVDAGVSTTAGIGVEGYIKATGFITGTTTLDLAEIYPLDPQCAANGSCPQVGDIVCAAENTDANFYVQRCVSAYDDTIVGVLSGNPGFVLGGLETTYYKPVALAGRVPANVSTANGAIKAGDLLTSSDQPGVAIKATGPGRVIGVALQSFGSEGSTQSGVITVFVNSHWSLGKLNTEDVSDELPENTPSVLDSFTLAIKNSLLKLGMAIKGGILKVKELVANRVRTDELCVGNTCVNEQQLKELLEKAQVQSTSAPPLPASGGSTTDATGSLASNDTTSTDRAAPSPPSNTISNEPFVGTSSDTGLTTNTSDTTLITDSTTVPSSTDTAVGESTTDTSASTDTTPPVTEETSTTGSDTVPETVDNGASSTPTNTSSPDPAAP